MEHQSIKEKLWALDDRELPEEERQTIVAHLKECKECFSKRKDGGR